MTSRKARAARMTACALLAALVLVLAGFALGWAGLELGTWLHHLAHP